MVSMTYIEKSYARIRAQASAYGEKGQRIPPEVREKMNAIARLKGVRFMKTLIINIVNHKLGLNWLD